MKPLTVIDGGRNRAEVIEIERRAWDETCVELQASLLERRRFARMVHTAVLNAMAALCEVQPNVDRAERWLHPVLRLAVQEDARAGAADRDGTPVAVAA